MTAANDNEPTDAERLIHEAQKLRAATWPPYASLTDLDGTVGRGIELPRRQSA